jgi:hypothetical protein
MRFNFHPRATLTHLSFAGALLFCSGIVLNVGGLGNAAKPETPQAKPQTPQANAQQTVSHISVAWHQAADENPPRERYEPIAQASSAPELGGTPTPAAQPHAAIEGVWAPDKSTCSIRSFREGLLATIISMDGAWAGDTFCIFQNRQQTETGWRVVAHCSKPGEQWTTQVRLTIKGDRLIWTSKRGTQAYTRCAPDFLMAEAR